jgi:hypothetical protein
MAYNMYSKVPFSPRRRLLHSANKYPPPPAPWSRHSRSIFSSTFSSLFSLSSFLFLFFSWRKTGICRLYSLSRALASPGWRLSRVNCQSQVFPLLRDCLLGKNTFTFTRRGEVLPHCSSSSSMRQVYHSRRCCRCIKNESLSQLHTQ